MSGQRALAYAALFPRDQGSKNIGGVGRIQRRDGSNYTGTEQGWSKIVHTTRRWREKAVAFSLHLRPNYSVVLQEGTHIMATLTLVKGYRQSAHGETWLLQVLNTKCQSQNHLFNSGSSYTRESARSCLVLSGLTSRNLTLNTLQ